jgi:glycerophosphoryl diester phosphodiesterase
MKCINRFRTLLFPIILAQFILCPCLDALSRDKGGNHYIDAGTAQGLRDIFRYTGDSVSFLSSHRGGPERNLPENCISTFANTLKYTWSIMEIDPRYTKDSVMVLLHDPTLQRTTTGKGKVSDFTLKELKELWLKDTEGNATITGFQLSGRCCYGPKGKQYWYSTKRRSP